MARRFKLGKFGIGVLIYVAVLILIIGIVLGILGSFLASFERNQPDRAAEKHISSLGEDELKELIVSSLPQKSELETADGLYRASVFAKSDELTYLKKADEYTSAKPVYTLLCGGVQAGKFSLAPDGKDSFNMTKWKADGTELYVDKILPKSATYTVKVPSGAALTVGGKPVSEEYATEKNAQYSGKVYTGEGAACDIYILDSLYSVPEISVLIDGKLVSIERDGTHFDAFATDALSQKISAPSNAAVMLYGMRIPASYFTLTSERMPLTEFEQNADIDAPTLMFCRVPATVSAEDVTSTVSGKALDVTVTDDGILAVYRSDSLRSVELLVPKGCEITLNGVSVSEGYRQGDGTFEMLVGMEKYVGATDAAALYRINGLLGDPEISVTLGDAALPVCHRYETGGVIHVEFYGVPSDALKASAQARALEFADAYITYTCQGYNGTDANHAAVMALALSGTDTYKKLVKSKESFSWAENYTVTDRSLVCGEFIPAGERGVFCTVDYTANLKKYTYVTEQSGTFRLLMVKSGGEWLVAGLLTETK